MKKTDLDKTIRALKDLKGDSDLFVKVYFVDENNYTIKFIDVKTGMKKHTMRKSTDNRLKRLDGNWTKKGELKNGED